VLSVRRALSGDMAPPPPSPRQLGAPAAVAPDSAPVPDAAARAVRTHDARPVRPWFSRLAATFWGPAADLEPTPSRSRRRAHLSAAVLLALTGMGALGWGAWTLDRPSLPPSGDPVSTLDAAMETTAKAVATSAVVPMPALTPTTPSAMAPVALWVKPEAPPQASGAESGVTGEAVSAAPKRSTTASPQAARAAPRDRHRTARPKVQASSAGAKPAPPAKNACDGTGLLARAWCVMTPCKAPRGRSNPECIERLRAEAARQQRVERQ